MFRLMLLTACLAGLLAGSAAAQTREEKVRNDKKNVEAKGYWLYNDLPKAFAEAKKSKMPIVVVLRCIPCVECVKLDDELIDADERLKPLLEKFVRVRVVSTNGLDLSLFQFDTDQSFAVFLLNADGTVYGRFGTRSHRKDWVGDVSVDGLAKALQGALELHKEYPKNKASLAAKRGPEPKYDRPEKLPALKERYKSTLAKDKIVPSCIHCHQIGEAQRMVTLANKETISEAALFPYPHPKTLGLILDPKEKATILKVVADSDADKAGFKAGDSITKLAGQPLLSIADVQWVLHNTAAEGAKLKAEVMRKGKPVELTLELPKNWRQRDDVSWRVSTWHLRRVGLGSALLTTVKDEDRKQWKLQDKTTALQVQFVGQGAPPYDAAHKAGLRKGDVVVGFNDRTDLLRETDVIAYSLRKLKRGQTIPLTILRDGKKQTLKLTLPQ